MSISIRKIKKRMKSKLPRNTPIKTSVYVNIQEEIDIILEEMLIKVISEYNLSTDTKLKDIHVSLALNTKSDGSVGIGTASPVQDLQLYSNDESVFK